MINTVKFQQNRTALTERLPSPAIWANCPVLEILERPGSGVHFFDDFLNLSQHVSDQSVQTYDSYIDTGVTIKQLAGVDYGVAEMAGNDADNDEGVLSGHGPIVNIQDVGASGKLWFECRWKKASVSDNAHAAFMGLAFDHGDGVSIAKTLALTDDDGALGAFSYLGFHVDQADGDALDFVYKAEGQSAVVVIGRAGTGCRHLLQARFRL